MMPDPIIIAFNFVRCELSRSVFSKLALNLTLFEGSTKSKEYIDFTIAKHPDLFVARFLPGFERNLLLLCHELNGRW
jgi:hypothetical protein